MVRPTYCVRVHGGLGINFSLVYPLPQYDQCVTFAKQLQASIPRCVPEEPVREAYREKARGSAWSCWSQAVYLSRRSSNKDSRSETGYLPCLSSGRSYGRVCAYPPSGRIAGGSRDHKLSHSHVQMRSLWQACASSFFNLPFSSSRFFSLRSSESSKPPYFERQL